MNRTMMLDDYLMWDPRTHDRVRRHTSPQINRRIDRQTRATVAETTGKDRDAILMRLHQLEREWDIDRALMATFAVLGSVTLELGLRRRAWLNVFRAQMVLLMAHAVVGWCPPVSVLRRFGIRTTKEIAIERDSLIQQLNAMPAPGGQRPQ